MTPPSRRQVLQGLGTSLTLLGLPAACGVSAADPSAEATNPGAIDQLLGPVFFTPQERLYVAALANQVLPPDDTPGAAELGAVRYLERLLTALERGSEAVWAGGPFSDRNPLPGPDGAPS